MMTKNEKYQCLNDLIIDISLQQKKGLHFILAAVVVWTLIFIIHLVSLTQHAQNILTIACSAPIFILAILFSKLIDVNFFDKSNPLYKFGIVFASNQMLYLPLSIYAFYACPDRMLMMLTVITGAHLLPFAWLYRSNTYLYFSIIISIAGIVVGWTGSPQLLAAVMLPFFILFALSLSFEIRRDRKAWAVSNEKMTG